VRERPNLVPPAVAAVMEPPLDYRDILVHVDTTPAGEARLGLGIVLAQRFNAHLTGIHIVPEAEVPPTYKPSAVERVAEVYAETARAAAATTEALFHDRVRGLTLATDYRTMQGDIADRLRQASRFVDLVVIGQADTENPAGLDPFVLSERVVFGSAAPMLVVPILFRAPEIGRSVLVGWDGSGEAARAIRDALPFLRRASRVTVVAVDPDRQGHLPGGADTNAMVTHLARHAVNAVADVIHSGERHAAEVLLSRAADVDADTIVMGAYGHLRVREFLLGGTTPDILEHTSIPVLVSR